MNKNTKDIINAITKMDISLLAGLLEDGQPYAGISKETFLLKMEQIFHRFQFDQHKQLKKMETNYVPELKKSTTPDNPVYSFYGPKSLGYFVLAFNEKSGSPVQISIPEYEYAFIQPPSSTLPNRYFSGVYPFIKMSY